MIPDIDQLKEYIKSCKDFNENWAAGTSADKEEIDADRVSLSLHEGELGRIEKAAEINSAIGVFGQSQCGKSYLVSELIGGSEQKLIIPGVPDKIFQDYNNQDVDAESTGVVTRLTHNAIRENAPDKAVFVRFLNPVEIFWSFVHGFYHEMNYNKGFELTQERKKKLEEDIASNDNAGGQGSFPFSNHVILSEFTECFNFVNEHFKAPQLVPVAIEYLRGSLQDSNSAISVNNFVLLASTFWNCDENITKVFRARIETLQFLGFKENGYLPEKLLKDTIDAGKLNSLTLDFNADEMFSIDNGVLIESINPDVAQEEVRIQNLQAIVKEVELTAEKSDDSLLNDLDVLDFPGARSLAGEGAGSSSQAISDGIKNGSSKIIKDMYKRGKLLYLFELYRKQHDITILIFCSENGPQAAPILTKMLDSWIESSRIDENVDKPALFVALTKSDMLLKTSTKDAEKRVAKRFTENFSVHYKWVDDFLKKGNIFTNFYLVRNPSADNTAFKTVSGQEKWREGYEEPSEDFRNVFMQNKVVDKYLGSKKEKLYDSVFYPGKVGIELLINGIKEKFAQDPEIKEKSLEKRKSDIHTAILAYRDKYYSTTGDTGRERKEKEAALSFISHMKRKDQYLRNLLNGFYRTCPKAKYLFEEINKIKNETAYNDDAITIDSAYLKAIPAFVKTWIFYCKKQKDFHDSIGVEKGDLNKYLRKMQKYFLQPIFIDPILKDFEKYFPEEKYSSIKVMRNYLLWIFGEKLYYLEHKEENGTPTGPVTIPKNVDFNTYIFKIWEQQLPEIYVENFELRQSTDGDELLATIG